LKVESRSKVLEFYFMTTVGTVAHLTDIMLW